MNDFILDSRIKGSSEHIHYWPLCEVRLKNNAHFPWLLLVPMRAGIRECYELSSVDQQQLMREITLLSVITNRLFSPDKLNTAAIGNRVNQLHIHIVARFCHDLLWPDSVWQAATPEVMCEPADLSARVKVLSDACQDAHDQLIAVL